MENGLVVVGVEGWRSVLVGGADCPRCGRGFPMTRALCAVGHDPVDVVPRRVPVVPCDALAVERVAAALFAREWGADAIPAGESVAGRVGESWMEAARVVLAAAGRVDG